MGENYVDKLELLTREDCLKIVKNYLNTHNDNDFELKSYTVTKASKDLVGFMGEYYKLRVEIKQKNHDDVETLQYFVKSVPLTNPLYRDECERKGFFRKESAIYANILPNISRYLPTALFPKAYLARNDIIVLEDFSLPEKNLKQLKEGEEYSKKHYQLFVQRLAQLHAASLAWEAEESIDIGQKFKDVLFELQLTAHNEWYITGIKGILYLAQHHPKYQYPQAQEFINEKLYNKILNLQQFTDPSPTLRNVLCHRDSWNGNLFWEYDDQEQQPISCRIVDFQLMRYSPPALDVLNFLYHNFQDHQKRDREVPDLLKFYYQSLKEELKRLKLPDNLISQQEFDEDCRRALLPVLTLKGICVPLLKLPKGWGQLMRSTEPETFDVYMNSDRREMFERVSLIDSSYRNTILIPIQEIMEYFGFQIKN